MLPELVFLKKRRTGMTTIKLLLVEDDPDIREVLVLALSLDPGIILTIYGSGEAALQSIASEGGTFDVALLDYRLPGMTGIELHQELRRLPRLSQLITVVITASLTNEYVNLFQALGIAGLISKPFDPLTLAKEVRALASPHKPASTMIRWLGSGNDGRPRLAQQC